MSWGHVNDELVRFEPLLGHIVREFYAPGLTREDLMQEARIGAWEAIVTFDGHSSQLSSFVGLCARRKVVTALKTATRIKHRAFNEADRFERPIGADVEDGTLADVIPLHADPGDGIAEREHHNDLLDRLRSLNANERRAVALRALGDSYDEIALAVGCQNRKSVDNLLQRARAKLGDQRGAEAA